MDQKMEKRIVAVAREMRGIYKTCEGFGDGSWFPSWWHIADELIAADDARIASEEAAKQQPPATTETTTDHFAELMYSLDPSELDWEGIEEREAQARERDNPMKNVIILPDL